MKASYWQRGETIDFKNNTGKKIEATDIVVIGTRIGVAGGDIENGETGAVHVTGVFQMKKKAEAVALGQLLYADKDSMDITGTEDGNIPAGWAVYPSGADSNSVYVKLLG
ncbi:MAG: DUF2190 family protein [Eubacteriales bacterium]|nr:DUF2190 family protein [Eubacteriales bacterium]